MIEIEYWYLSKKQDTWVKAFAQNVSIKWVKVKAIATAIALFF